LRAFCLSNNSEHFAANAVFFATGYWYKLFKVWVDDKDFSSHRVVDAYELNDTLSRREDVKWHPLGDKMDPDLDTARKMCEWPNATAKQLTNITSVKRHIAAVTKDINTNGGMRYF